MNNLEHYGFKLVCLDENDIEFCVLEDLNRGNLEDIHTELLKRITKYNIGNTKWILLPIHKKSVK